MTPSTFAIAAFACLGLAAVMVLGLLRTPGWQLRDSPIHALVAVALGAEAALVLGLWETASAPGLRTGTPMIVLLASLPLAAVALRQGMTPRGVRAGRLQRLAITLPAIGAVVLWWLRLEAIAERGRTLLEVDLLGNAASIAGYGIAAVTLIALVPVFAAFRQKALRRAALPFVAAAALVLPTMVSFSGATVEATCAGHVEDEIAWCQDEERCLVRPETYSFARGAWFPHGGELASYAWQRSHALEAPEVLQPQLLAFKPKDDEHGLYLTGAMAVDGVLTPREVTAGLMWVQGNLDTCFAQADSRGELEPELYLLSFQVDPEGYVDGLQELGYGDAKLQSCVDTVMARTRFTDSCSDNQVDLELIWLGPEPETSASL